MLVSIITHYLVHMTRVRDYSYDITKCMLSILTHLQTKTSIRSFVIYTCTPNDDIINDIIKTNNLYINMAYWNQLQNLIKFWTEQLVDTFSCHRVENSWQFEESGHVTYLSTTPVHIKYIRGNPTRHFVRQQISLILGLLLYPRIQKSPKDIPRLSSTRDGNWSEFTD